MSVELKPDLGSEPSLGPVQETVDDEMLQRLISRRVDDENGNGNGLHRRRQSRPTVSVVVPALNEEQNLPFVLPRIGHWVDEVILVDGNSTDRTCEVAREILPDVRIVQQPEQYDESSRCGAPHRLRLLDDPHVRQDLPRDLARAIRRVAVDEDHLVDPMADPRQDEREILLFVERRNDDAHRRSALSPTMEPVPIPVFVVYATRDESLKHLVIDGLLRPNRAQIRFQLHAH